MKLKNTFGDSPINFPSKKMIEVCAGNIIDFHTHTFPDKIAKSTLLKLSGASGSTPFTDATVGGLTESAKKAGIGLSVVLPVVTNPAKCSSINQKAAAMNEEMAEKGIFSIGGYHPEADNYKEILDEVKALGLKGIKLHPDYYGIRFDDIRMMRAIDYASEIGLFVITHAGKDIGLYPPVCCDVESVKNVIREVHPEKLVLAHMGGWNLWDEVLDQLAGENVYLDTAFSIGEIPWKSADEEKYGFKMLSDEKFCELVRAFGSDRICFATDSPWADQKDFVKRIMKMPLTDDEKYDIFRKTAAGLLGIETTY